MSNTQETRRRLGAYYTPKNAAEFMAAWVVRESGSHILEPSFGEGIFVRAVADAASAVDENGITISAVEIDSAAASNAEFTSGDGVDRVRVIVRDFLSLNPFDADAVIGNPPYVRLRHLLEGQREQALTAAGAILGEPMDPSGSLWMPFVLHATRFLNPDGRLAFVLPYDLTYVRYARPLWEYLGKNFEELTIARVHERLFPDLLQQVVILFADGYGGTTNTIRFKAYESASALLEESPDIEKHLELGEVVAGEKAFVSALLPDDLTTLIKTKIHPITVEARKLVTFNIGYVTGHKEFFHPEAERAAEFGIPAESLRPALTSNRALRGKGIWTSRVLNENSENLFLPNPEALSSGERDYIAWGESTGVDERYKCRVREPWFVVPGTRIPDVVLTVFSNQPLLLLNDAKAFASNSLLCGYLGQGRPEELVGRWYTSLTLLESELKVHALGGGVLVMVPGEAGAIRLLRDEIELDGFLKRVNDALESGDVREAYRLGDEYILEKQLGWSKAEVALVEEGIDLLSHWRKASG